MDCGFNCFYWMPILKCFILILMSESVDDSLIANGQSTRPASVSECDIKLQEAGGVRSDEGFKNAACGSTTVTKPSEHHESCEKKKEAGISADVNSEVLSVPADPSRAETAKNSSVSPPTSILSSPVSVVWSKSIVILDSI